MSFLDTLKNIGSGIVSGAKNVFTQSPVTTAKNTASAVGGALQQGASNLAGVGGAALDFFTKPNVGVLGQAASVQVDPETGELRPFSPGTSTYEPTGTTIQDLKSRPRGGSTATTVYGNARPASSSQVTSSRNLDPKKDASTQYYRPPPTGTAGAGGFSGTSTSGGSFVPPVGDIGGGRSAFTGLLGAAGVDATGIPISAEDESKIEAFLKKAAPGLAASNPALAGIGSFISSLFPQGPKPGATTTLPPSERIPTEETGSTVDAPSLAAQPAVSTTTQPNLGTMQETLDQIRTRALEIKAEQDMVEPTPPEPVVETFAQLEALSEAAQGGDFSLRDAFDELQKSSGLTALQGQRIDLLKSVQAANEAIMEVYEDIKTNPDFPKGLAARRLADVTDNHKIAIQSFLGQLDITNQMIDDANMFVNRELQILESEDNKRRQAQQDLQNLWKFLGDMGGLGALSDQHISMFANGLGISESALQSAVKKSQQSNTTFDLRSGTGGSLYEIERDDNGMVLGMKTIIEPSAGGGSGGTSQFTATVGGNVTRFVTDSAGNVISQTPLGESGTDSIAEKENKVLQYIQSQILPNKNQFTQKEAEEMAKQAASLQGVAWSDKMQSSVDEYNSKSSIRAFLGF